VFEAVGFHLHRLICGVAEVKSTWICVLEIVGVVFQEIGMSCLFEGRNIHCWVDLLVLGLSSCS
jgi:hypothetical protein